MGILRILLAICVVVHHAPCALSRFFLDGETAVQSFFIISGFYMAMVLDRRYNFKGAVKVFYQQRYLRLAPMYWVTLVVTIVAAVVHTKTKHSLAGPIEGWVIYGRHLSLSALVAIAGAQITMFGMDILTFCRVTGNPLHLAYTGSLGGPMNVTQFRLVLQAWSLSTELLFYVLAPFLVRRSVKTLVILIALSCIGRWVAYQFFGLYEGAWQNRFFPFELGLFLAGALSYRCLGAAERAIRSHGKVCAAAAVFFFVFIGVHNAIRLPAVYGRWLLLIATAIMVPVLFSATQKWTVDRWIGELSYPLYLVHWITLFAIYSVLEKTRGVVHESIVVMVPLAVAIGAQVLLESRFDAYRHRLFRMGTKSDPDSLSPECAAEVKAGQG